MKITGIEVRVEAVPLTRPYTIATSTHEAVDLVYVGVTTDGADPEGTGASVGLGCASPAPHITGETLDACRAALARADWLAGEEVVERARLARRLEADLAGAPAARAALDMALWDLFAKALDRPLVDVLGRVHDTLPTSITIGIKSAEEALEECDEYLARGFRHIKVKIGDDLEADIERVALLQERVGTRARLRVDANQGYGPHEAEAFFARTEPLGLELIEQPLPASRDQDMIRLSAPLRASIAADESLHDASDALRLAGPRPACGIYNIKLMKCGGITGALAIATVAEHAGVDLMWGCMDESVISIAAALHAAFACPTTRYLDLDGSLDLARDLAVGGFRLEGGRLQTLPAAGLGARLVAD